MATGHFLFGEIAVLDHAREFDDAAELELAPCTGRSGTAERGREASGLGLERALGRGERAELLGEGGVGGAAGLLDLADTDIDFLEGIANRFHQRVDGRLAFVEVAPGALLELGERGLGQLEEGLVVALQGVGREGLEGVGEARLRILKRGEFFGGGLALGVERGRETGGGGLAFGGERAEPVELGLRGGQGGAGFGELGLGAEELGTQRGFAAAQVEPDEGGAEGGGDERKEPVHGGSTGFRGSGGDSENAAARRASARISVSRGLGGLSGDSPTAERARRGWHPNRRTRRRRARTRRRAASAAATRERARGERRCLCRE